MMPILMQLPTWVYRSAVCAGMLVVNVLCVAQTYPAKPMRMIVPFSPGGPNDLVARVVGQKLTDAWGQTLIIDNRGGAGGNIGVALASKASSDGYTLLMVGLHFVVNP